MKFEVPIFDCPEEALKAVVQELGGSKVIGSQLWPDKGIENSARLLNDCLNIHRAEKLDVKQITFILSKAKELGKHTAFNWIAGEIGYEIHPITKEAELDRVTLVVEEAGKNLVAALETLERIQRTK